MIHYDWDPTSSGEIGSWHGGYTRRHAPRGTQFSNHVLVSQTENLRPRNTNRNWGACVHRKMRIRSNDKIRVAPEQYGISFRHNIRRMQTDNDGAFTRKIRGCDHKRTDRIVNHHIFTYTTPTRIGFRPAQVEYLYIFQGKWSLWLLWLSTTFGSANG